MVRISVLDPQTAPQNPQVVICPGIHPPALTAQFIQAIALPTVLPTVLPTALIYPAPAAPAYAGHQILRFLLAQTGLQTPLLLIGFSAGVVGAITAADLWQALGGRVVALIAFDGWGMPLRARFPVHRFSHDAWTHWSSALLDLSCSGSRAVSFYAEPPVGHLNFWRAPQLTTGWAIDWDSSSRSAPPRYVRSNAAEQLRQIIASYSASQII